MADQIKGITIQIGGDTSPLNKALKDVNKEASKTQKELREVNKALKGDPKNADLLRQKQELLTKSIEQTSTKLKAMQEAKAAADKDMENGTKVNEEQYRQLTREISLTEQRLSGLNTEAVKTKNTLSNMDIEVQKQKWADIGTEMEKTGKKIEDVGGEIDRFGDKLTKGVTVPLLAIAGASVAAFTEVDDALDTVVTATGATGEALESLQGTVKDVASTTKFDIGDIGNAVGEVNTQFGSMGPVLQDQTERLLKFADITGADVVTSTQNARQAMVAYKRTADDLPSMLDIVARTAQNTGVSVDKLWQATTDGSYQIRELGLSFEEGVAMMGQFEQSGVDSSKALTYLSKAAVEYAKDGKSLSDGFNETVSSIKNATTETEALAIASEVFGTRGAVSMIEAINRGTFSLEGLQGAAADAKDAVNTTFENTLDPIDNAQVAMNNAKLALSELGEELQASFGPILEDAAGILRDVTKWFQGLDDQTKQNIIRFGGLAVATGPVIKGGGKVISTVGKMTSYLGKTAQAMSGAEGASTGLSKVLSKMASPGGAILLGVGAVAALGVAWYDYATKESREANKALEETKTKLSEMSGEIEKAQRQGFIDLSAADVESERIKGLRDELAELVTSEGKVKEGQEERVDYIMGELNTALGTQLTRQGDIIEGYNKEIKKIDELIEKKKAEMKLKARESEYNTAQQHYTENLDKQKEKYQEIQQQKEKINKLQTEYNEALERGISAGEDPGAYNMNLGLQANALSEAKKKLEALREEHTLYANKVKENDQMIQNYESAALALQEGNYKEVEALLNRMTLAHTVASGATKSSLADQAAEWASYSATLKENLANGVSGVTEDMVKNAEELAIKATAEYQKAGGEIANGLIVGIDENGDPIYKSVEGLGKKAIDAAKLKWKDVRSTLKEYGMEIPSTLAASIGSMDGEVQYSTMQLLAKVGEGVSLSEEETKELFANLGIDSADSLIQSMISLEPSVYGEALSLLKNLESATEAEKPTILKQLSQLGIDMDADLATGIKNNRSQPVGEAKTTGKEALAGTQTELQAYNPKLPKVDGTQTIDSAVEAVAAAHKAAQRKMLDLGDITIGVFYKAKNTPPKLAPELADGGVFNRPTTAIIGETYQKEYVINVQRPASGLPLLKSAAADMGYVLTRPFQQNNNSNTSYDDHSVNNMHLHSESKSAGISRREVRIISAEMERMRRSNARGKGIR